MDYMTLKEAAEKWGVTPRRVNYYCAAGRIPGAVKMAGVWLIPKNAEKPSLLPRQCPNHYTFRAGQNLPDKEFRYLRTVIVTAAVHWGFGSMLRLR